MAKEFVPAVESGRIGAEQPLHAVHEIGLGSFHHQMEVITHQAPGVDLPVGPGTSLGQSFQKQFAIFVVEENVLAMIAAIHEVINGAWVLNSELSGHGNRVEDTPQTCQY